MPRLCPPPPACCPIGEPVQPRHRIDQMRTGVRIPYEIVQNLLQHLKVVVVIREPRAIAEVEHQRGGVPLAVACHVHGTSEKLV